MRLQVVINAASSDFGISLIDTQRLTGAELAFASQFRYAFQFTHLFHRSSSPCARHHVPYAENYITFSGGHTRRTKICLMPSYSFRRSMIRGFSRHAQNRFLRQGQRFLDHPQTAKGWRGAPAPSGRASACPRWRRRSPAQQRQPPPPRRQKGYPLCVKEDIHFRARGISTFGQRGYPFSRQGDIHFQARGLSRFRQRGYPL